MGLFGVLRVVARLAGSGAVMAYSTMSLAEGAPPAGSAGSPVLYIGLEIDLPDIAVGAMPTLIPAPAPLDAPAAEASSTEPHAGAPISPPGREAIVPRRELTIVGGGDLGLNGHMQPVDATGAMKHGARIPLRVLTERLAPLINGDLNFANLETVVTDRNDLRPEPKTFNFRTHPAGVAHLVDLGFNLISTANNHGMDFGAAGALETIAHLDKLKPKGLKAHAGLGRDREEAAHPALIDVRQSRVAFSAIGIVTGGFPHHRASHDRPGQLAWQAADDFEDAVQRLAFVGADYRILSVHHGIERDVRPDPATVGKLRRETLQQRGIDLVVGHHAHVVQGIEVQDGRVIFYGLGNLLHPGMQNMASLGICRDYGLLARVHLASNAAGHLVMRAVEAIPLTDMHLRAAPMPAEQSAIRVHVLNALAAGLDDSAMGARGMRFAVRSDGTGLYCAPGAASEPGRAGQLCAGWRGETTASSALTSRISAACGPMAVSMSRRRDPGAIATIGRAAALGALQISSQLP